MNTMMKSYEPFPILRFCVVWLYIFIPSKARSGSFVPADSIIFVAEDAYVYSETSVFVAGSGHNKGFTSAKKSKDFLKRSSLPFSTQKSVIIAAYKVCYTGSPWNRNDPGRISRTSMLGITGSPSLKLHDKTIKPLFPALAVIGRDRKQFVNSAFYPFQITHIIINHVVRPPPVLLSEDTKVSSSIRVFFRNNVKKKCIENVIDPQAYKLLDTTFIKSTRSDESRHSW